MKKTAEEIYAAMGVVASDVMINKELTTPQPLDAAEAADRLQLPLFIHVPDVPVTEDELTQYAGERCGDFDESCSACQSWKEWDETGRITVLIEREILLFGH